MVVMREGRCLMSDGQEGVVKRTAIEEGYPWDISIGGVSKYLVNDGGHRPGNRVIEMLDNKFRAARGHLSSEDQAAVENTIAVVKGIESDVKSKPMILVKQGDTLGLTFDDINIMVYNRSLSEYKVTFDLEKIETPVPLVFEMDQSNLYRWATCFGIRLYKDGAQYSLMWMQFETEPSWAEQVGDDDYGYIDCTGRSAPIIYHEPKLPGDGIDLRDTLTFVTEDRDERTRYSKD